MPPWLAPRFSGFGMVRLPSSSLLLTHRFVDSLLLQDKTSFTAELDDSYIQSLDIPTPRFTQTRLDTSSHTNMATTTTTTTTPAATAAAGPMYFVPFSCYPPHPAARAPGREHVPLYPRGFLHLRILQLVMAIAALFLAIYVLTVRSYDGILLMVVVVSRPPYLPTYRPISTSSYSSDLGY